MVDLIAKTPTQGLLPITAAGATLFEATPAFITSVMPFAGQQKALAAALKSIHDLSLPAPGRSAGKAALRVLWSGRGQYFLVGDRPADPTLAAQAALTDQTDGWAVMSLESDNAADVLARLCPLDLRAEHFKRGHTARTELAHMMSVITRTTKGFEIMVMRSFAKTAVHNLEDAMKSVAAQSR